MVGSTSPYSILLVAGDGENASINTLSQHDVPKTSMVIRGVDHASLITAFAHIQPRVFTVRSSTRFMFVLCGAVGGAVALVVIIAVIYVVRLRRNVRRLQRSMDVLGPELTPLSHPPDNTDVHVTLPIYSHFKTDNDLSPVSSVEQGRLHRFSTPSAISFNEQTLTPLPSTLNTSVPPVAFPPLTSHRHGRSLSSSAFPLITSRSEETFDSLSPTRTPTWTTINGPSSAVSIRTPGPYERPRSLSTPVTSSPATQSRSSLSHTRRMTIGAPSTPPPLRLHEYRPSTRSATDTPPSPTRRRRRRRRPAYSVDGLSTPPQTPDQNGRLRFPNTPPVTTPADQDDNDPPSPIHRSTIIIGPPPPAARRTSDRYNNSRALIRSPNATKSWHVPISHPRNQSQNGEVRSAREDSGPEP